MPSQSLIRTYVTIFAVSLLLLLISACSKPEEAASSPENTAVVEPSLTPSVSILTATVSVDQEPTATAFPTRTPTPTQSPNAITRDKSEQLEILLRIEDVRYGAVNAVTLAPDGSQLAIGTDDRIVRLFGIPNGELEQELVWHDGPITMLAYAPDGQLLVSGAQDRTIQLWQPETGERITGVRTASEPSQVVFDPAGDRFSYAGLFSALGETRSAIDATTLYQLEGHTTRLRSIAQSSDGVWIATGDRDGIVVLHGAQSGRQAFTIISGITAEVMSLAFSPDSKMLAVGLSTGQIQLWDIASQQQSISWTAHSNGVRSMVFSVDGLMVISGGTDTGLRLWDIATGDRVASYPEHDGAVNTVSLSQDGRILASGSEDSTSIIWQIMATSPNDN